jgi:enamine deaminase RidA (YjgF/YER057c/UK114 family)
MSRQLISSGSRFEAEIGYSRPVVDGDWIFAAGTTGFDYSRMTISDEVASQCEQTLRNIDYALEQADAAAKDIVRVRYILPRREDFEPCWPVLKKCFDDVRPAATMIQAGLGIREC